MRRALPVILFTLGLAAAPAMAQKQVQPVPDGPPPGSDVPPPPEIIKGDTGEGNARELEPQVTIREGAEGQKIQEYRIKGKLYMMKVTPKNAPAYYVVDRDGDGTFETRYNGPVDRLSVPQWVLMTW